MLNSRHLIVVLVLPVFLTAGSGCASDDASEIGVRSAGDTVIVDATTPNCATCTLEVGSPIVLGSEADKAIPRRVPDLLRDSRGNHYETFNGWDQQPILRYDSTGRLLGILGGYGGGPGEYEMTFGVFVGPGDSMHVFAEGKVVVFSADGAFVRSVVAPRSSPFAADPDGRGGFYGFRPTWDLRKDTAQAFVVRYRADGTASDSFSLFQAPTGDVVRVVSGKEQFEVPMITRARPVESLDGSIWTLTPGNRIEQHAPDGKSMRVLGLRFPGGDAPLMTLSQAESLAAAKTSTSSGSAKKSPPKPATRITALQVDQAGLLWVLRTFPAPGSDTIKAKVDYLSPNEAPEEGTIPEDILDRKSHTYVDVIDPKEGIVLARAELPFRGVPVRAGYVGRITTNDDGFYVVSVYPLRLRR